jgi:long-chain acyl-CoA synthetase
MIKSYKNPFHEEGKHIESVNDLIDQSGIDYAEKAALRYKAGDSIVEKKYKELLEDVKRLAGDMEEKDLYERHVILLGKTSYEYIVSYLGIIYSGNVVIPIDKDLNSKEHYQLMKASDADCIFCDGYYLNDIIRYEPEIENIYVIDGFSNSSALSNGRGRYVKDILDNKSEVINTTHTDTDKLAQIVYTSGTTGISKGVMLSQKNLANDVMSAKRIIGITAQDSSLSVLPLYHTYEMTCDILLMLYFGASISLNDSMKYLRSNLKVFKPTILFCVPMVLQSIQNSTLNLPEGADIVKELGGSLKRIVCGGAYLDQKVIDYFDTLDITVVQGYGITECSPLVAANPDEYRKKNSVGRVITCCEVSIDCNENNNSMAGEILVRGSNVMLGYYKDDVNTKAAFKGTWFRTGDIGYLDEDNYLYLMGRIKNLIILSNGKNVSAEKLEEMLSGLDIVKEVLVDSVKADSEEKIRACIYPDFELAGTNRIKNIESYIEDRVRELNRSLPSYMQISCIQIRDQEFPKTSINKIKRYLI